MLRLIQARPRLSSYTRLLALSSSSRASSSAASTSTEQPTPPPPARIVPRPPPIDYTPAHRPDRATAARLAAARTSPSPPRPLQHRQNGKDFDDSRFLSDRVKLLASRLQFDEAIELVKSSQAANIVVWNVLLHEILQNRKFKRAFELWMDMKRRGLRPSVRSYTTFFNGHVKIKEIESASLARVKTVFAQWELFAQSELERIAPPSGRSAKARGSNSSSDGSSGNGTRRGQMSYEDMPEPEPSREVEAGEEITCIPTNAYLHFLGNTNHVSLMLETFSAMPSSGPLAPDATSYSIVLSALRSSKDPAHFQAAVDLWKMLLAQVKSTGVQVDTLTVSTMISICRDAARVDDQKMGFEVAQQFYGFVLPANEDTLVSPLLPPPLVALDAAALSNVFSLALKLQQYNLLARWFDQVRDYPKRFGAKQVLESWHCDLLYLALAAKKDATGAEDMIQYQRQSPATSLIQPTLSSYTNAIQVCWRSGDLPRAIKILELMTQKRLTAGQLVPLDPSSSPSAHKSRTVFLPDERIASTLLQAALTTKNRGDLAHALEIVEAYGFTREFYKRIIDPKSPTGSRSAVTPPPAPAPSTSSSTSTTMLQARPPTVAALSHAQFWRYKFSEILERTIDRLLHSNPNKEAGEVDTDLTRRRELSVWRGEVVRWLEYQETISRKPSASSGEGAVEESMKGRRELLKEREERHKLAFAGKLKAEKFDSRKTLLLQQSKGREEGERVDSSRSGGRERFEPRESRRGEGERRDYRSSAPPPQRFNSNNNRDYDDRSPRSLTPRVRGQHERDVAPPPTPADLARREHDRQQPIADWPAGSLTAPRPISLSKSDTLRKLTRVFFDEEEAGEDRREPEGRSYASSRPSSLFSRNSDGGGGGYGRERERDNGGGGGYGRERERDNGGGGGYGRERERDNGGGGGYGRERERDNGGRGGSTGGGYGRREGSGEERGNSASKYSSNLTSRPDRGAPRGSSYSHR